MVLFFTTTLGISIFGMLGLLAVKRFELTTGRVIFQRLRPKLNHFFHNSLVFVERILPALVRVWVERLVKVIAAGLHRLIAQSIVFFEYWLQRILDTLRMTTHAPNPNVPASAFLREVAEHKKTLLKRSRSKRVIVHE